MAAARTIRSWDNDTDQEARVARAFGKGQDLIWTLTPAGSWQCTTPQGKDYIVSATHCECKDWEHRCSKVGAQCYHQVALGHKLIAEGTAFLTPPAPKPEGKRPAACVGCGEIVGVFFLNENGLCKFCVPVEFEEPTRVCDTCGQIVPEEATVVNEADDTLCSDCVARLDEDARQASRPYSGQASEVPAAAPSGARAPCWPVASMNMDAEETAAFRRIMGIG